MDMRSASKKERIFGRCSRSQRARRGPTFGAGQPGRVRAHLIDLDHDLPRLTAQPPPPRRRGGLGWTTTSPSILVRRSAASSNPVSGARNVRGDDGASPAEEHPSHTAPHAEAGIELERCWVCAVARMTRWPQSGTVSPRIAGLRASIRATVIHSRGPVPRGGEENRY